MTPPIYMLGDGRAAILLSDHEREIAILNKKIKMYQARLDDAMDILQGWKDDDKNND